MAQRCEEDWEKDSVRYWDEAGSQKTKEGEPEMRKEYTELLREINKERCNIEGREVGVTNDSGQRDRLGGCGEEEVWPRQLRGDAHAFLPRPGHPPPTSTSPCTFGTHGADEQLCPAPGPPGRSQHRQAPRSSLAHEQSHFTENPTLMQPEPASRL